MLFENLFQSLRPYSRPARPRPEREEEGQFISRRLHELLDGAEPKQEIAQSVTDASYEVRKTRNT